MDEDLRTYFDTKFADMEARLTERVGANLDGKLGEMETRLTERMDGKFGEMEARLTEKMRDMQTELLRGFESFSTGQTIRLRKLEADQSNLDVSLRGRVDVVESRLLQIELRLGIN
jgi:hypothetical protein